MRTLILDSKDRLRDTGYMERETDNWLFFASILLLLWGLSSPLEGKNGSFAITAWRRWPRGSFTAAGGRATFAVHALSSEAREFAQQPAVSSQGRRLDSPCMAIDHRHSEDACGAHRVLNRCGKAVSGRLQGFRRDPGA